MNSKSENGNWRPSRLLQIGWLIGFVAACFAAAGLGGMATSSSVGDWYQSLAKPAWTPPAWIFGPVWSALFMMMAVAAWLVWRCNGWASAKGALGLFAIQLALNVGWSVIFFGLKSPGFAMLAIVFLWLAIASTICAFWRHSRLAAAIMLPYLVWSTFASILNLAIFQLNT